MCLWGRDGERLGLGVQALSRVAGVSLLRPSLMSSLASVHHPRVPSSLWPRARREPTALSLSAMPSLYFIGGMMPESASPVQEPQTIIEIRPYRGGWQCYEGLGVQPYWTGDSAKQSATDYAKARQDLAALRFACLRRMARLNV
jgi:hypothetical protein